MVAKQLVFQFPFEQFTLRIKGIVPPLQRPEDKRRRAGHCEPIVRLSGHRSAGHLPDADRAVRTPIPDPDARSERERTCSRRHGEASFCETPKVEVADTVGAGDSFTAGFCSALLRGKTTREAHRLAVDVSAYVCTQNGAMPVLPESLKKRLE